MTSAISVLFIGSGDAFGSGGRFQTCILLEGNTERALIDCGASSLVALKASGTSPATIGTILITHLHGDHFGGIPFFILDAQFAKRSEPLIIAGPPHIRTRVREAMEVFFPKSSEVQQRFPIEFIELQAEVTMPVRNCQVTGFPVLHFSGAPAYALRVDFAGRTITYSGDTEWTDMLLKASANADLFVCEAYFFEKKMKFHLDYRTLADRWSELTCKRIVLTHMSNDMLDRLEEVNAEVAYDGLKIEL
jgi:ribonuclease BN (tRNA processing enzyme)